MKKADSDIVFGILLILLGFAIGYGIWLWGAQMLFIRSAAKQSADIVFFLAFIPAVIIFYLWYRKNLYRSPVERQHGSLWQLPRIVAIAVITTVGLVVPGFFLNYMGAIVFAILLSTFVTVFSGIAFYKFRPY